MVSVSFDARWSSQRMTFRSVLKSGAVMEMGSSVSVEKRHSEHVASKPMPWTCDAGVWCSSRARRTTRQIHRQMSDVDCSYVFDTH
jgi:hypothetical protein